ncbi:uncharacterized protein PV09_06696 [Verruconis gallopava]|uniref:UBZ4-type domain-containing protein n=1 Tax=Verruconis gallopava TaxID=253628 RepID=A0A0D1YLZ3_9PEZI|nr:uncharacterized protein PV09_06696 [Verruconis gallopava]KIW01847.1 hypothetical protein PV09_06696 [Verruconis gallopava]
MSGQERRGHDAVKNRRHVRGSNYRYGRGCGQENPQGKMESVPSAQQVVSGAGVSIILKIDQPTGRQVQGIVAEVLGRGDHPRGIKVRLVDGRVGRVQSIVSEEEAKLASAGLSNLGRNGEPAGDVTTQAVTMRGSKARSRDVRFNNAYHYESSQAERETINLMDYVKKKPAKAGKSNPVQMTWGEREAIAHVDGNPTQSILCPVCGDFEGDEEAVAHHVSSHFEEP